MSDIPPDIGGSEDEWREFATREIDESDPNEGRRLMIILFSLLILLVAAVWRYDSGPSSPQVPPDAEVNMVITGVECELVNGQIAYVVELIIDNPHELPVLRYQEDSSVIPGEPIRVYLEYVAPSGQPVEIEAFGIPPDRETCLEQADTVTA